MARMTVCPAEPRSVSGAVGGRVNPTSGPALSRFVTALEADDESPDYPQTARAVVATRSSLAH
jgi:hypothetical protein